MCVLMSVSMCLCLCLCVLMCVCVLMCAGARVGTLTNVLAKSQPQTPSSGTIYLLFGKSLAGTWDSPIG